MDALKSDLSCRNVTDRDDVVDDAGQRIYQREAADADMTYEATEQVSGKMPRQGWDSSSVTPVMGLQRLWNVLVITQ